MSAELVRVRVWSWPVRVLHWTVFFTLSTLAVTGIYLGSPFVVVSGPAREHFVTGTMKVVHFYAAAIFVIAVIARIVWMFTGDQHARWRNFVPTTKARFRDIIDTLGFYLMLKRKPPPEVGHNAVAGAAYLAVFALYLLMILTGVAIYSVDASAGSWLQSFRFLVPIFGGLQWARWIHHAGMWLLIGFVVQHVYSSVLMSSFERSGVLDSIFSGYKHVPREHLK